MPRLDLQQTEKATLSPRLTVQVQAQMELIITALAAIEQARATIASAQEAIELACGDTDEYEALLTGFNIETSVGSIPVKKITGGRSTSLDKPALMRKFQITPQDWKAFSREKPKADYFYMKFPGDAASTEEPA